MGLGSGLGLRFWAGLPHGGSRRHPSPHTTAQRCAGHAAQSSSGTQGSEWRSGRRCGSSASMLCSRVSSRPCRSTTSSIAVRERSCTAHDTAPVSRILSQYPGILRRYPRYQGGIPAVLYLTEPVALATSHTTNCCYSLRRSRRAADRAAQLAASRGVAHGGSEWRRVGVVVVEIVGVDVVLAGFLAPLCLVRSVAV